MLAHRRACIRKRRRQQLLTAGQAAESLERAQGLNASFGGSSFLRQLSQASPGLLVLPIQQEPLRRHAPPNIRIVQFVTEFFGGCLAEIEPFWCLEFLWCLGFGVW